MLMPSQAQMPPRPAVQEPTAHRIQFLLGFSHATIALACIAASFFLPMSSVLAAFSLNFFVFVVGAITLRKAGIVHLDLVFLTFLFIYSISVPLSNALEPKSYDQSALQNATELCMLAYFGFALGILFQPRRTKKAALQIQPDPAQAIAFRRSGIIVFWIGVVLSIGAISLTTGFSEYLSAGYAGRALLKREAGPIEIGLYVCTAGLFAAYAGALLSNSQARATKLIVSIAFLFFLIYVSFLGIRRPLFLLALGLIAGYSIIRHRPNLRSSLLLFAPAFVFFTTFAQYRQLLSAFSLTETFTFIKENANWRWLDVSETELGAPFRSLLDYLSLPNNALDFQLGLSYVQAPVYIWPSFLTGGLQSLSVEYTHLFFSDEFISIGGNMGFFPVTEAYLNFGEVGVLIIFMLYGLGLTKANNWFHVHARSSLIAVTFFMTLVPWAAFFMRLDFSSFAKGFFYSQLVPLIAIYLIGRILKTRIHRRAFKKTFSETTRSVLVRPHPYRNGD